MGNIKHIGMDQWDVDHKGDRILVDGLLCVSQMDGEYRSVFGHNEAMHGVHHWKLKIVHTTYHMLWNTMIGILQINKAKNSKQRMRNTYFTENGHAYAFIGNCCKLEPNKNVKLKQQYGEMLDGSIIDVIL